MFAFLSQQFTVSDLHNQFRFKDRSYCLKTGKKNF